MSTFSLAIEAADKIIAATKPANKADTKAEEATRARKKIEGAYRVYKAGKPALRSGKETQTTEEGNGGPTPPEPPPPSNVLAGLTKYVPTESITLYVATVSAQGVLKDYGLTSSFAYWFFVFFTPVLLLLLFFNELASAKKEWNIPPRNWPWWKIVASSIAFAAWALAVPGNPLIPPQSANAAAGALAALAALFVSTILNLFAPLFEKK